MKKKTTSLWYFKTNLEQKYTKQNKELEEKMNLQLKEYEEKMNEIKVNNEEIDKIEKQLNEINK